MLPYKEIASKKRLFRNVTWTYLTNCINAYDTNEKLAGSIWSSVFLESLLKDILGIILGSNIVNEEMNALISRLRNALNNRSSKYEFSAEDSVYLEDIMRRSDEIRLKRNRLVHSTGVENEYLDSDGDDIYKNIIAIINDYCRTGICEAVSGENSGSALLNGPFAEALDFPMFVGSIEPYTFEQAVFVEDFCNMLRSFKIRPVCCFLSESDKGDIIEVSRRQMEGCQGVIIIGLERTHSYFGKDYEGTAGEQECLHRRYGSSLLQVVGGMALGLGKKLFVLRQKGLHPDGIFMQSGRQAVTEFQLPVYPADIEIRKFFTALRNYRLEQRESCEKDIYISFDREEPDKAFVIRLAEDLRNNGYSVYLDTSKKEGSDFPERLGEAVSVCKDFIFILSENTVRRFSENKSCGWMVEELRMAKLIEKHIILLLVDGAELPENASWMPELLKSLAGADRICFSEDYNVSPFTILQKAVISGRDDGDPYKNAFNSNPFYDVYEDFVRIEKEAEKGDIRAMYEAGMMSYYGVASDKPEEALCDFAKASFWLKKVEDSGDDRYRAHAQSILGRMYYQGLVDGEPQSYEKCYKKHFQAAEKDAFSKREVSYLRREGIGCSFDFDLILQSLQKEAVEGDEEITRASALFLKNYGKYEDALELLDSVPDPSVETEYQIGMFYLQGVHEDPPRPDYFQAAYHLRNAADNGHVKAAYQYGVMCLRPSGGLRKDFQEAERYLKISADAGYDDAQYVLGYMYRTGLAKKDLEEARKYLEKAFEQNFALAALELATLYQQPGLVNYGRAFLCASFAAGCGMTEGELILGNLLFLGRGCEPDMKKAMEMYRRAYDHGYFYASIMMKKCRALLDT